MKKLRLLLANAAMVLIALGFAGPVQGGDDELAVIVNKGVNVKSLSQSDLRPIFQTTRTSWVGGKALPLNLPPNDSSRKGFDAAVLGLDPDRIARYWVDRKIRGGNPAPKKIPSSAMVVKVVSMREGAIGYVPFDAVTPQVKVVAIIRGGQVVQP